MSQIENLSPPTTKPHLGGISTLRVEQAKLLKSGVVRSCSWVLCLVVYIAGIMVLADELMLAALWVTFTSTMIAVVFLYARFGVPNGVDSDNYDSFLKGHVLVSALTGSVWGGFSIYLLTDPTYLHLFIAGIILCTITAGGMFRGTAYRPSYIALATTCIVPAALYWIMSVPGTTGFIGVALLLYYAFGMLVSASVEIDNHEVIAAKESSGLMAELQEKNKLIQRAYEEKSRYMASTSHDLSQPLHAQGYFIQALRKELNRSSQHELLDRIEASWQNQSKLLQGIIDVTRIESGVIVSKPQLVNLAQELADLSAEFKNAVNAKQVTMTTHFAAVNVHTDPLLLKRILRNLLDNAVKFSPQGGEVNFSSEVINGTVTIRIADNGPGIPLHEQDNVFQEYVQLTGEAKTTNEIDSKNNPGTHRYGLGLGLSIVQRLTQLLGIRLRLDSSLVSGTEFTLYLSEATDFLATEAASPHASERFQNSPLILVVDDEKDIRDAMSMLLTDWGCQVMTAASSDEAINVLDSTAETPSLFIVDKRLSATEDGFDVIVRLREEVNADISAVIMTGDLEGFEKLRQESDIHIMPKPIAPNEIRHLIEIELISKD